MAATWNCFLKYLRPLKFSIYTLILLLTVTTGTASAQLTSGTITGTVTDESQALIPGVDVTVTNPATGLTRDLVTNEVGRYEAPNLPIGTYEVTAALPGFGTAIRQGVALTVGRTAVIDIVLQVGQVAQTIEVQADALMVETTQATVAHLIDQLEVENLPLVNRDLTQLAFLQPGILKVGGSGDQGVFSGMGDKFSVAGARGTQNLFLLDGVSNQDLSGNAQGVSGALMGAETVQELQIITNNYSAEYRSAAGGIVSAVTKSGTNEWHGSLFEFFRNEALNSENYFDKEFGNPKPRFRQNQFGGSVGGPIIANKLFFFGSYEGYRQEKGETDTVNVPSLNARAGRLADGTVVDINPTVLPYLNLYPVPGQGNQIVEDLGDRTLIAGTRLEPANNNFFLTKLDYEVNADNRISGTYNFDKGDRSPLGLLADTNAQGITSRKHLLGTKWTSVLSSNSVNEFNFSYADSEPGGAIPLSDRDFEAEGLIFRENRTKMGQIAISGGFSSIGYRVDPSYYRQRTYTLKDGFSLIRGDHSFRVGGEWTYFNYNMESCSRGCNGIFSFRSMEHFLEGIPRRFEVMLPGGDNKLRDMGQHLLGLYFQDNWRATDTLTFNLGVRYETASVPTEVDNKFSNLENFFADEVTLGVLYDNPTKKAFSPRVGIVWAPNQNTSIRTGFGIFYEHPMLYNIRTALQELPPFTQVGRIDDRRIRRAIGEEIDFPNAFSTQIDQASARTNIRTFQKELDLTYIYRWNLTIQRQFANDFMASAEYTGSRGLHLWNQSSANLNRWEGWPEQPPPGTDKFFPEGSDSINPNFGEMRFQSTAGNAYYHGGAFALQYRPTTGPQFSATFNYSKAIDDGSGVTSGGDELQQSQRGMYLWDFDKKRGLSSFDIRRSFTMNGTYALPFGDQLTGPAGVIGRGWQLNGVATVSDGYPVSVRESSGDQEDRIGDDSDLRPDLIPGGHTNSTGDPNRWVDVSQFTPTRLGYFGNLGRNTVTGPGLVNVDLSFFKNTDLSESTSLQFRVETFNLFNRNNFATPDDMNAFRDGEVNPNFARITRTQTPARSIQLGLRFTF